jgi:hypothetical protein
MSVGFPVSTSHPEGISTETMGRPEEDRRGKTSSKGGRTGPLKEKPKIASRMTSEDAKALRRPVRSDVGGRVLIFMFSHWVWRRWGRKGAQSANVQRVQLLGTYFVDIFRSRLLKEVIIRGSRTYYRSERSDLRHVYCRFISKHAYARSIIARPCYKNKSDHVPKCRAATSPSPP